ncbi:hybrid sensor histidine kinase/response regulator [Chitinophaga solisilvae]|uniref:hybrid sensor histidine kinase/response regulator n=1 Tax=Chitinophaga solisilvae TaxID=1233460 RepID=UPI00136FEEF9|nr:hybrid sensor histidine kinase/response regulator [Chitinophaga solisilvae]
MEVANHSSSRKLSWKEILSWPVLAGTRDLNSVVDRRQVIVLNNILALVLSAMVLGIGSYFYALTHSIYFVIGVPVETLCFWAVIYLNHRKLYYYANLQTLVVNAIFAAYWSTVLSAGISPELVFAFIMLIIFHLASTLILYKKKAPIIWLVVSVILAGIVIINAFTHFVVPLELTPRIAFVMRAFTSVALSVLILLTLSSYMTQIRNLLRSERRLKEIAESRSIFLRETYHELRTPFNAIFGIAQLFQRRKNQYTEAEKQEIDDLFASCYIARNIINNVLDMSRVDSGKFYHVIKKPVNLKECVSHCVAMNSYLANSRGIFINNEFDTRIPASVESDQLLLTKVINNVLSNAVKFAPGNSAVTISTCLEEEKIVFRVKNLGVIEPEIAGRIFDPFVSGRNQMMEGTGLGLCITKHLLELMEGSIALEQDETETIFAFNIPLETAEVQQPVSTRTAGYFKKNCFAGASALVIEDNLLDASLAKKILIEMGIRTIHCQDGSQAFDIITAEKPDIILTDINMPGYKSTDMLHLLRSTTEVKDTPVIVVSGDVFKEVKDEMMEAGANAFLGKPIHFTELYLELSKHLPQYYAMP